MGFKQPIYLRIFKFHSCLRASHRYVGSASLWLGTLGAIQQEA